MAGLEKALKRLGALVLRGPHAHGRRGDLRHLLEVIRAFNAEGRLAIDHGYDY